MKVSHICKFENCFETFSPIIVAKMAQFWSADISFLLHTSNYLDNFISLFILKYFLDSISIHIGRKSFFFTCSRCWSPKEKKILKTFITWKFKQNSNYFLIALKVSTKCFHIYKIKVCCRGTTWTSFHYLMNFIKKSSLSKI
jgi:hypothetical protein